MNEKYRFSFEEGAEYKYTKKPYYNNIYEVPYTPISNFEKAILICITIVITFIAIVLCLVSAYKHIKIFNTELEESKMINEEYKMIYNSVANVNEELVKREEVENLKKYYEKEERDFQKAQLLKAETKLAKKICPIGSYIEIIETHTYVRVKDFEGFNAITWDGIDFYIGDTNTWRFTDTMKYYNQCIFQNRIPYIDKNIALIVG